MSSDPLRGGPRPGRPLTRALAVLLILGVVLTGCGDSDDSVSDQAAYCEAGDAVQASLAALVDLDLLASGTLGLRAAVEDLQSSVVELRDSAGAAAADDVEALRVALGDLGRSLSDLGDELSADNVGAVRAAVGEVLGASEAVTATLGDC